MDIPADEDNPDDWNFVAWLRTSNGAINSRYVREVYAFNHPERGWIVIADMELKPDGKPRGWVLNVPELTIHIQDEVDARKAIDKLMDVVQFEEDYEV